MDFTEGAAGRQQQDADADGSGEKALADIARAADRSLDGSGGIRPKQAAQLLMHRPARRVVAEHRAGDRHGDNQKGRKGEQREIGDRSRTAEAFIGDEALPGIQKYRPQAPTRHGRSRPVACRDNA